jgi:ABC-2 type transport system ATP-binding protein
VKGGRAVAAEAATVEVARELEGRGRSEPSYLQTDPADEDARPLAISGIEKRYGSRPALLGVSASFDLGLTALLGPNGAGKSTLIRCLAGIQTWDSGKISVFGQPLDKAGRRQVGYMPETTAFPKELRVDALLRFACAAKGIKAGWRDEVAEKAQAAGIAEFGNRVIGTLSKGYRQRLALAQAMLGDPPILVLDEPVASLDPISVVEIQEAIRTYSRSACVIVSTHQLAEARALCDRVLILDRGRLAFDGPLLAMGGDMDHEVEIHVRGLEPELAKVVVEEIPTAVFSSPARQGEDLVLRLRDVRKDEIATVVRHLVLAGGDVTGVEAVGDSLENAFARAVSIAGQVSHELF